MARFKRVKETDMLEKSKPLYGAIEGGGTKFVCAVGSGLNDLRAEARFDTTTPAETMTQQRQLFKTLHNQKTRKYIFNPSYIFQYSF